jgi:DNA-binding NarL/FixJ family response regulator
MAYSASPPDARGDGDRLWLAAALEHLPVAVGLVDRAGRFMSHSGALRFMLGEMIPSRSTSKKQRWIVTDQAGQSLDPRHWPSERALRGETVFPGSPVQYLPDNAPPREMRVTAAPFAAAGMTPNVVVLVQEAGAEARARTPHHDHLEARFAETLIEAISDMLRDQRSLAPDKARTVLSRAMGLPILADAAPVMSGALTQREAQVLKLLAWGVSQKEVGARLGVSAKTVDFHRTRAGRKLNLRTRTDLIRYAARRGWFADELL